MSGIGVINNPKSRQNINNPDRISLLGYILGEAGSSRATHTFEELEDCLREFRKREIDILAINGGDGSNHVTLTKLIEIYGSRPLPKVALLRGGTLNTISRSFNIKGKPDYLLHSVAAKFSKGEAFKTTEANLMNVNGQYAFLFGNGFVANFMNTYYSTGTPSPIHGLRTLVKGIISVITGTRLAKDWVKPIKARVTVDGEVLDQQSFVSILAGTVEDIGVGFKPWARAFDIENLYHVLFIDCSPLDIVSQLSHFYRNRPLHPKLGAERTASQMTIEAEDAFYYTLDGDMYNCEDGKMNISIGPRVTIIVE